MLITLEYSTGSFAWGSCLSQEVAFSRLQGFMLLYRQLCLGQLPITRRKSHESLSLFIRHRSFAAARRGSFLEGGKKEEELWPALLQESPFQGSSPTHVYNNYLYTLLVHDVLTRAHTQYYVVLTYYSVPALLPQAKKSWVGTYIYV